MGSYYEDLWIAGWILTNMLDPNKEFGLPVRNFQRSDSCFLIAPYWAQGWLGDNVKFRQGLIFFSNASSLWKTILSRFLLFFNLIFMKSTSSRIKNFWIPKPTSLLSVESPDTLEMDKFDKWFSIDISLPFFLELPTKEPQVIWITFRGLGIENSFLVQCTQSF